MEQIDLLGGDRLDLDCAGLTFMGSTGIGALLEVVRRACEAGGEPHLRGVPPFQRRIIEITQLVDTLHVDPEPSGSPEAESGSDPRDAGPPGPDQ